MRSNTHKMTTLFNGYYFFIYAATGSFFPLYALYLKDLQGLSDTKVGIIISIKAIISIIVQPLWGLLSDKKLSQKKVLFLSNALSILLLWVLSRTGTFLTSLIIYSLFSIFYASILPISDSLALNFTNINKRISFGQIRSMGSIGFALFAFLIAAFVDSLGYLTIFYGFIITSIISLFCLFNIEDYDAHKDNNLEKKGHFLDLLKHPLLISIYIYGFFFFGTSFGSGAYLSLYIRDRGGSITIIGLITFFMAALEAPIMMKANMIVKRFGALKVLFFIVLLSGFRLVSLSFETPFFIFSLISILRFLVLGLLFPTTMQFIYELVPTSLLSSAVTLYVSFTGIGAWVGTIIAGIIIDHYSYSIMFRFFGIASLSFSTMAIILFVVTGKLRNVK